MRWFFWVATTYVLVEKQEKIMFNSVVLSRDTQVNAKYHLIGSNEKDKWPRGYKNICAPVLLNLSNSLQKRDKMLSKPSILSLFPYSFNKFNKHEHSCTCKILYVFSRARSLNLDLSLHLYPYYVYMSSEGSGVRVV